MALGRRKREQQQLWVATSGLPRSAGHPFYRKLNELLASSRNASNRMIGIEDLEEQDLRDVAAFYARLAERAKASGACKETHSIDDEGMPASEANAVSG